MDVTSSYVLQKMIVLPTDVLRCLTLSTSGPNDTPMVDFSRTQKKMFFFTGDTVTTTGSCISSDRMILVLVLFVAVAVSAITHTCSGMMLLISPRRENSRRKLSPLFMWKYYYHNLSCSCSVTCTYLVSQARPSVDKGLARQTTTYHLVTQ